MKRCVLGFAVCASLISAPAGASADPDSLRVFGAIAGGILLNEVFRGTVPPSPRADGPYSVGVGRGRLDPNRICGYTPIYHRTVVEIVATNCYGEVVGRRIQPR